MSSPTIEPVLIGKRDAARMLGLGISTLERYILCGWVPKPVKIGNALRWRIDELREWINAGCPKGRPAG